MKYGLIFSLCALCPAIAFADSLDNKIATLTKQKMDLINSLEKCQKATGNLKVAGIATLGVSAIGVGANVTQAKKIKTQNAKISNLQDTQTSLETQIEQKKAAEAAAEARLAAETAARQQAIAQQQEQQEQQEQQGEDATEKRVEEEIIEGENENKDDIVAPEDKVKENPTERTDGGECTAAELVSVSAATGKWSVKSNKCIPTSCVGGAWLVLKNGKSQGWCVKKCSEFKDYDSNEGPWPDGGKYCELIPKNKAADTQAKVDVVAEKTQHTETNKDITAKEEQKTQPWSADCETTNLGVVSAEWDCELQCQQYSEKNECFLRYPAYHFNEQDSSCYCNPTNEILNQNNQKYVPSFNTKNPSNLPVVAEETQKALNAMFDFGKNGYIQNRK